MLLLLSLTYDLLLFHDSLSLCCGLKYVVGDQQLRLVDHCTL